MPKKKILVFDDDEAILEVIQIILIDSGFEIEISKTSHDILERVSVFLPDLILMDYEIPDIGGVAAIKLLRGNEEFKNIPVLLISASNHIASLQNDCEAEDHIKKPFDLDELVSTINRYVL